MTERPSDQGHSDKPGVSLADELERLGREATQGPWAWDQRGEKVNEWGLGTAFAEDESPYVGHFTDENATYDEYVCSHEAATCNYSDPALICTLRNNLSIIVEALRDRSAVVASSEPYQLRVDQFMLRCFGFDIAEDTVERNHRFLEESLELVQALGCTAADAHMLVDYVYGRPTGEPHQEAGGVMVTLAALCTAAGLDMTKAGEDELARVFGKIDIIREKQKAKPKGSPLPEYAERPTARSASEASIPVALLREHWLHAIECNHATKQDMPICACSKVNLGWHPSVGAAVEAWLTHLTEAAKGA